MKDNQSLYELLYEQENPPAAIPHLNPPIITHRLLPVAHSPPSKLPRRHRLHSRPPHGSGPSNGIFSSTQIDHTQETVADIESRKDRLFARRAEEIEYQLSARLEEEK